jgi:hypothetical protein
LPHRLQYRVIRTPLVVCRLAPDTDISTWASKAEFFSATRTRDELSIVCSEEACVELFRADDQSPDASRVERGWIALKLEGPFPFSMTGVLVSFLHPLAEAQIPIFAISTFATDYVLIKQNDLKQAVKALAAAGHEKVEGDF